MDTTADDTIQLTVSVTNVDEDGTVSLSPSSPRVGNTLNATLTDPDSGVTNKIWKWERSDDGSSGWITVGTAANSYTVVAADLSKYLRATVNYTDGQGPNKTAYEVSANTVREAPSTPPRPPRGGNTPPRFPGTSTTRSVDENAANTNVGSPVTARDSQVLTYTVSGTDAAAFSINRQSGQLQTPGRPGLRSQVQLLGDGEDHRHGQPVGHHRRHHQCDQPGGSREGRPSRRPIPRWTRR